MCGLMKCMISSYGLLPPSSRHRRNQQHCVDTPCRLATSAAAWVDIEQHNLGPHFIIFCRVAEIFLKDRGEAKNALLIEAIIWLKRDVNYILFKTTMIVVMSQIREVIYMIVVMSQNREVIYVIVIYVTEKRSNFDILYFFKVHFLPKSNFNIFHFFNVLVLLK